MTNESRGPWLELRARNMKLTIARRPHGHGLWWLIGGAVSTPLVQWVSVWLAR